MFSETEIFVVDDSQKFVLINNRYRHTFVFDVWSVVPFMYVDAHGPEFVVGCFHTP